MKGFTGMILLVLTALNVALVAIADTEWRVALSVFCAVVCAGAYGEWLLDELKERDE